MADTRMSGPEDLRPGDRYVQTYMPGHGGKPLPVGDTARIGVSPFPAAADHVHEGSPGTVVSTTAPENPDEGQVWFNPDTGETKVWDGTTWRDVSIIDDTSYLPLAGGTMDGGAVVSFAPGDHPNPVAVPIIDGPAAGTTDRNYLRVGYPGGGAEIALYGDDDNSDRAGQLALRATLTYTSGQLRLPYLGTVGGVGAPVEANAALAIKRSDTQMLLFDDNEITKVGGKLYVQGDEIGLTVNAASPVSILDATSGGVTVSNGGTARLQGDKIDILNSVEQSQASSRPPALLADQGGGRFALVRSNKQFSTTDHNHSGAYVPISYSNPGSGSVTIGWWSNYLRFRFGGNSTPQGIIVSNYDNPMVTLQRGGTVFAYRYAWQDHQSVYWEGESSYSRHKTTYGEITLGPRNTGGAHIYTDRSQFYLDATLSGVGTTDLGTSSYYWNRLYVNRIRPTGSTWTYNSANGSIRWMGIGSDLGQAHTSSSLTYKRDVQPIRTRPVKDGRRKSGVREATVFDRLEPIWFRYDDSHPFRDRWRTRRPRADRAKEFRRRVQESLAAEPGVDDFNPDPDDDEWYEDYDGFAFENPPEGRMGFAYEQVKEVVPHFAYEVDGMEAVAYEGMLPDFMAWAVATIRDLRQRLDEAGL